MSKNITTVSIDPELLDKARAIIPNLSAFVEDKIRERIYAGGNPNAIEGKMIVLQKEIEILKEKYEEAKSKENSNLAEAVSVCLDQLKTKAEIPTNTLNYWAVMSGLTAEELKNIVFKKYEETKK